MISNLFLRFTAASLLSALVLIAGQNAWAEAPRVPRPNAGTLMQESLPPPVEPALPSVTLPSTPEEAVAGEQDGARIKVARFVIEGASLLPAEQLEAQLSDLVGQELNLAGLRKAAARITATYRERGYFLARAYLPAQEIADGVVHIAILEGRYDRVEATGSPRLDQQHVEATLEAHDIVAGKPIERADLERSLILMEQKAGAPAQALLQPGATMGTSHMVVEAPSGPLFSGYLGADNYGNRYSGEERATASFNLNSPRGVGDRASLWLMGSSGSNAIFASYQTPVGYDGLTLGVSASRFNYTLCCEFNRLDEEGDATVYGIQARYPLLLSTSSVMYSGLSFERKHLHDDSKAGEIDDKNANVFSFSLDGINAALGGQNRYRAILSAGNLDVSDNRGYAALDKATIDTDGNYLKLRGEFEHLHPLMKGHALDIRLSGQMSNRNLDSSEEFMLGGSTGVRAYPEGEAIGDEGLLLRMDWLIPVTLGSLPGTTSARLFMDAGTIWVNEDTRGGRADIPGIPNNYALAGAGFGLSWSHPKGFTATLDVATKIGSNPGASANGDDADGKDSRTRAWIGAEWAF